MALKEIVENGYGVIAIFYNDGIGVSNFCYIFSMDLVTMLSEKQLPN